MGAVEAVALSAASTGALAGVPIRTEADRARIDAALVTLVRAAFAA